MYTSIKCMKHLVTVSREVCEHVISIRFKVSKHACLQGRPVNSAWHVMARIKPHLLRALVHFVVSTFTHNTHLLTYERIHIELSRMIRLGDSAHHHASAHV